MGSMYRHMRKPNTVALMIMVVSVALCFSVARSDSGANVDDATCLMCHDGMDKTLASGPHRLASEIEEPAVRVACENCHEGAAQHVDNPSRETIKTVAEMSAHDAVQLCSQCHVAHVALDNYGFDAHAVQELNCADCHKVHGSSPQLLLDDNAKFCEKCHLDKVTDGMGRTSHPIRGGFVTCLNCHRFVKRESDDVAYQLQGTCRSCHPEQAGPYLYEHDAVNAYSVENGGCTECHAPHGSENDRLLKQPGQMLCRQCHMVPTKHLYNQAHGNAWARYDCTVCHTAVHGSFDSNIFLDPNLEARWGGHCFNCHSLNQ